MSGGRRPWVVLCVQNLPVPKDRRVWREARTLAAAGHRVAVVAPRGVGERWAERRDGVEILRFPPGPVLQGAAGLVVETAFALVGTALRLAQLAWRAPLRVVHAANPPDTFFLLALPLRPFGTRFVYDQHDLCPELVDVRLAGAAAPLRRALRAVLVALERGSYAAAHLVVAPNGSYRRMALTRGRRPPASVVVVRSGPDAARPPAPRPPRTHLVVSFAGVMGRQDRLDVLLEAAADLLRRRPGSVRLDLVGTGDDVPRLRALAESLGVAGSVAWAGWLTGAALDERLAAADVAVSLDDDSPFSRMSTMTKVPEYLALGLPCVVADLPENRVSAGAAALYFTPEDHRELAKRLEELLDDEGLRRRMAAAAAERAPHLLWEASARRLVDAYRWLLDGGPVVPGDQPLPQ